MDRFDADAFAQFIDSQRTHCLWFLRRGYYPSGKDERLRVLDAIERHGDVEAFKRARAFRAWLSQSSSETCAG